MKPLIYFRKANRKSYQKHRTARLASQKRYRQSPGGKATQAKKDKRQQQINALHWAARAAVWRAVKAGNLHKPPLCQARGCVKREVEGHHYLGYDKANWLNVIWLCAEHHRKVEVIGNIYENPELLK